MAISNQYDDVRLAHLLADNADSVAMSRYRARDLRVDTSADGTPVTDADLAVEDSIRATLRKARPRDGVRGQERQETGEGTRRWIVDPIDGTANYVRGVPVWATLIALEEDGEIVLGVVSAPALHRRWWGSREGGSWAGRNFQHGSEIRVSDVLALNQAHLSYSSVDRWVTSGRGQQFVDLLRTCERTRAFGDFWQFVLVAEGALDAAVEPALALHDMAACAVIVQEAGGEFTNLDGAPGPHGPGAIASNALLHQALVAALASRPAP